MQRFTNSTPCDDTLFEVASLKSLSILHSTILYHIQLTNFQGMLSYNALYRIYSKCFTSECVKPDMCNIRNTSLCSKEKFIAL